VIDHIIARQHGGSDEPSNLALCCVRCNQHKGPNIAGLDPELKILTALYHPRSHLWNDHFAHEGPLLVPKSATGRTTIFVLAINHPLRVTARRFLLEEGVSFS
jgi:hypothetical protein